MANIEFFNNSQGVQAERIKFVTNISSPTYLPLSAGSLESQYFFMALTMQKLAYCTVLRT